MPSIDKKHKVSKTQRAPSILDEQAALGVQLPKAKIARLLLEIQKQMALLCHGSDYITAMASRDCEAFLAVRVDPALHSSADAYYLASACRAFLRKYEGLGDLLRRNVPDPEAAAKRSFYAAEQRCAETNIRLQTFADGFVAPGYLYKILQRAQVIVGRVLGRAPSLHELELRFGPGATHSCRGDTANIAAKLTAFPECYRDSVGDVSCLRDFSQVWFNLLAQCHPHAVYESRQAPQLVGPSRPAIAPRLTPGNVWVCVPKDAKTHRGICIEAHTSGIFQLGIGTWLSDRLRKAGIGKEEQERKNKHLASRAHIDGLSTIDLSSASDTLAYETVRLMLAKSDPAWFELLERHRAPRTNIDGTWVDLEKFSSMGNGYTFELETIVFYSLARACADTIGKDACAVSYGDDIIITREAAPLLLELLDFLGFIPNIDKTYISGRFFESCGSDWFDGFNVRPYHVKKRVETVLDLYGLHNGLVRFNSVAGHLDPRFKSMVDLIVEAIPPHLRLWGPMHESDQWLITLDASASRRKSQLVGYWAASSRARSLPWGRFCDLTRYVADLYQRRGSVAPTPDLPLGPNWGPNGVTPTRCDHISVSPKGLRYNARRLALRGTDGVSVGFNPGW